MKKILSIVVFVMLIVLTSWAQSEPKMNYQAVLRDGQNKLVTNTSVQVTLTVQNAAGVAYYMEPQTTVTTNQNGLMTLTFGGGANWNNVNWKDANLVIDATWGEGNNIKDTVAMTAVPYAMCAANGMTCEDVKECINDTLGKYTPTEDLQVLLQNLTDKINELNRALDSVSQLIPFVCGASSVVDHEGNKYKTVEITTTLGTKQCWMAENMRCTTAPAESGVTLVAGGLSLNLTDYSTPRYYPAGNVKPDDMDSATYVNMYGVLYNFPAAMAINAQPSSFEENHRGICPEGWHMPTREELTILTDTPYWDETTAFNPLPAGYVNKFYPETIQEFGTGNCFWSATPSGNVINAIALYQNVLDELVIDAFFRNSAFSVRCLRNN